MIKAKTYFYISILAALIFSGCAPIKECTRGFFGVSTKVLEDKRPEALMQTFDTDYATVYEAAKKVLDKIHAYIYAEVKDKGLIAIYVSEEDTTPVGIFFSKVEENKTRVEVSSPSSFAKELITSKLFPGLLMELNKKEK